MRSSRPRWLPGLRPGQCSTSDGFAWGFLMQESTRAELLKAEARISARNPESTGCTESRLLSAGQLQQVRDHE